jgi:predicted HTH domain antitoxin
METVQITIELPKDAFSALRQDPGDFVREMRVAAAVKWYENGTLSQSKAAEIAGLSRSEFVNALNQFKATVFQYGSQEIIEEVTRR